MNLPRYCQAALPCGNSDQEIRETTANLRIIDVSTDVRTEYLPNRSQDSYRSNQLPLCNHYAIGINATNVAVNFDLF
jgi:hypothetical protein